jgi:AcrR family transcriptional regulator
MSDIRSAAVTEAVLTPRRYRGLSAAERRTERRTRLLEAGYELFGSQGYVATSIERLCAQAGVTTRHFYEEFTGREDVLSELCDEVSRTTFAAVQKALDHAPDDAASRTRAGVQTFVTQMLADPRRARILLVESLAIGGDNTNRRKAHRQYAELIQTECQLLADKGLLPKRDFGLVSTALVGATNELLVSYCTGGCDAQIPELIDELVHIFIVVEGRPD